MNAADPAGPERFHLLATFIAGRAVDVAPAPAGEPAYTDGKTVFVWSAGGADEQRRQVLLHSALLGAGSLDPKRVKGLRARPSAARRYLAVEGRRVLWDLADQVALAAALRPDGALPTASADESLDLARSSAPVADPPAWFGVIKTSLLLSVSAAPGARPADSDVRQTLAPADSADTDDDDDDEGSEQSKILKLFETPLMSSRVVSDFLRKLLGTSRGDGDNKAGAELQATAARRARGVGALAQPLPTPIQIADDRSAATRGVAATLHPEWDVFADRYRPDWCRVITAPLSGSPGGSAASLMPDAALRRRLSRVGLGAKVLRARADGDELDIDALIGAITDMSSGHSSTPHIYSERRYIARDLGVLVLLDTSGSVTDTDTQGLAVHDLQRQAAATLTATLEELGDRVALYAFRSHGRHDVHLLSLKTFEQRFSLAARARLAGLQPSGYTRLGSAIRGAGDVLKTQSGTPSRLLLVVSDGFPYDHGYEGRYAEADAHKALEELRANGVACLCLSFASNTDPNSLNRVFGSASHATAATLADLTPRIDELFLCALRELATPRA